MDANAKLLGGLMGGDEPRGNRRVVVKTGRKKAQGPEAQAGGNNREVLVAPPVTGRHAGPPPVMAPTTDPFDRAHQQLDGLHGLAPACRVLGRRGGRLQVGEPIRGSRPRLYPAAQMVTGPLGPVGADSQFDAAYERAQWLAENLGDVAGAGEYLAGGARLQASRERLADRGVLPPAAIGASSQVIRRNLARSRMTAW